MEDLTRFAPVPYEHDGKTYLPLDFKPNPHACDCICVPDEDDGPEFDPSEDGWMRYRQCLNCGSVLMTGHCPHDGYQSTCQCGTRFAQFRELE